MTSTTALLTPTVNVTVSEASEDRLQQLVDVFSEVYNQAADSRGWCSEAEEVTRAANEALAAAGFTVTLKQRETLMEGYLDVPLEVTVRMPFQVTVPRSAENEVVRQALIKEFHADTRSSDQMIREALAAGPTRTYGYGLGYVSIEWMDTDFDEVHWDARPA